MPRVGMNPNRGQQTAYRPARITLALLTYLPNQAGYFQQRFDVTRLCLESLIANTPPPYDLLVFDNGSCPELVDTLHQMHAAGHIQYLLLSQHNIGKIGALRMIFNAAPGELVAYTDDDVLFLPGWLDEHLKLLETFPKTGLVTGFYIRSHLRYGMHSLEAFMQRPDVISLRGKLIPPEVEQHYMENMGRTPETYQREVAGLEDIRLTYQQVEALASAGHHQFVAPRQLILDVLPPWEGQLMGKMVDLENAIDAAGYLRLSTVQPVTRLLGNVISAENAALAQQMGLVASAGAAPFVAGANRFYRLPFVRRLALSLYNRLHTLLNAS